MTTCKIILTPTNKEQKICHALATTSAFNLKLCHMPKTFCCIYTVKQISFLIVSYCFKFDSRIVSLTNSPPSQPWLNLRLAWLVLSRQLESTVFNCSLALCLAVTGEYHSSFVSLWFLILRSTQQKLCSCSCSYRCDQSLRWAIAVCRLWTGWG